MKFRKVFLCLFFAYLSYASANAAYIENELDINAFLRSRTVVDNKVYLQPGTIYITADQILLNIQGHLLPIGNLASDTEGIFTTVEEMIMAAKNQIWICHKCNRVNSMEDRWCAVCGKSWNG